MFTSEKICGLSHDTFTVRRSSIRIAMLMNTRLKFLKSCEGLESSTLFLIAKKKRYAKVKSYDAEAGL